KPPPPPLTEAAKAERDCARWFNMAHNYQASGMKEKAREYLQKIIAAYPDTPQAEQARQELMALGN
ncbi:MAG: tetratricopeptide repeat protein, partial [Planctomycetota bacterium]